MAAVTPTIGAIRELRDRLQPWLVRTPVIRCPALASGSGEVYAKLELLQRTSTFKPRGALAVMLGLDAAQRLAGVTAVSAGNHAIATAFAARAVGTSAKVVMPKSANPLRIVRCREYGAEVVLADDVHAAFAQAERIRAEENRFLVHPFEGPLTSLGTATLGLEICEDIAAFDALIVPIGGGGLCSGVAAAVRQLNPDCKIYGVEPFGADAMHRSFSCGEPQRLDRIDTIADSLGAPFTLPYSFALCRRYVDRLVRVNDAELRSAMRFIFHNMKWCVEAACAASTAALLGPLSAEVNGKRVVIILCGSNIDWDTFATHAELEHENGL